MKSIVITCNYCGTAFSPTNSHRKYCCDECRIKKNSYEKNKERVKEQHKDYRNRNKDKRK